MFTNVSTTSTEFAIAIALLLIFGVVYNQLVERFQKRTKHFTAELVVGGVLVTVLVSSYFIGINHAATVLSFFVASGLPMMIGSWLRAARDEEEAKRIQKEPLK